MAVRPERKILYALQYNIYYFYGVPGRDTVREWETAGRGDWRQRVDRIIFDWICVCVNVSDHNNNMHTSKSLSHRKYVVDNRVQFSAFFLHTHTHVVSILDRHKCVCVFLSDHIFIIIISGPLSGRLLAANVLRTIIIIIFFLSSLTSRPCPAGYIREYKYTLAHKHTSYIYILWYAHGANYY